MAPTVSTKIHPLVRDLYKRALFVGRDYPQGMDYVRQNWKKALRNVENCPSCYAEDGSTVNLQNPQCLPELHKAVGKGRYFVREMIALIQFKKYRHLKQTYDDVDDGNAELRKIVEQLQAEKLEEKAIDNVGLNAVDNSSSK
ncbi:MAG: hypothetical protein SGILL_006238 [Bacillariaceae sp.]